MGRLFLILGILIIASAVSAADTPAAETAAETEPAVPAPVKAGEFYWFDGEANIAPIDLDKITKSDTSLRWSYAVDCSAVVNTATDPAQKTGEKTDSTTAKPVDTEILSCTLTGASLHVSIKPNKLGEGKIVVQAIGRNDKGAVTQNYPLFYSVKVSPRPTMNLSECVSWDCALYTAFYLGYEGTSVSQVNQKGNLRLQYSAYSEINSDYLHIYGDMLQTSLQEQAATQADCTESSSSTAECDIETTLAASIGGFMPFSFGDLGLRVGPMLEYNLQKLDTDDVFAKSYYTGIRFAYSKIRFFSIGYGKSEGIPGERIKFTGQLPIYNDKLIAGMNLNVSVDNTAKDNGVSPGDSINIYIITRVDFTKIFTSFAQ